jgi:hypothetical protein
MSEQLSLPEMPPEPEADCCPKCGSLMEYRDCWQVGCDEGWISLYDDDPLWYDEDDEAKCDICDGKGGWYVCTNCHPEAGEP